MAPLRAAPASVRKRRTKHHGNGRHVTGADEQANMPPGSPRPGQDRALANPAAANEHYTYRVSWSEEDQEYVATCAEFPRLSHLAGSQAEALEGIGGLVAEIVAEMRLDLECCFIRSYHFNRHPAFASPPRQ
jgi:predicted RNase H-like HicB family nuclease